MRTRRFGGFGRFGRGRPDNPNRSLDMAELLAKMQGEFPAIHHQAKIVGRWVWVMFDAVPDEETRDYLKECGFIFSPRRQAWMHPCGSGHRGRARTYDPRTKYGCRSVEEVERDEVVA